MYTYIYIYIHTYTYMYLVTNNIEILRTRNRHLRDHRGFPVAFSNGLSAAFSDESSTFGGVLQRIVTSPVDFAGYL